MSGCLDVLMASGGLTPQNTIVAGTNGTETGFDNAINANIGSITPSTAGGIPVNQLVTQSGKIYFALKGDTVPQNQFTTLTVWGPGYPAQKFSSASATFVQHVSAPLYTQWSWSVTTAFTSGDTYYMRLD